MTNQMTPLDAIRADREYGDAPARYLSIDIDAPGIDPGVLQIRVKRDTAGALRKPGEQDGWHFDVYARGLRTNGDALAQTRFMAVAYARLADQLEAWSSPTYVAALETVWQDQRAEYEKERDRLNAEREAELAEDPAMGEERAKRLIQFAYDKAKAGRGRVRVRHITRGLDPDAAGVCYGAPLTRSGAVVFSRRYQGVTGRADLTARLAEGSQRSTVELVSAEGTAVYRVNEAGGVEQVDAKA